jgi:hypothetical protein
MSIYQTGWTLQLVGGVPTLDTTLPPIATNPFGSLGTPPSFLTTTARIIIDSARLRHWSFTDIALGDGAVLLFLNQRQNELLAKGGAAIEGIVGTAIEYAVTPNVPMVGFLVSFARGVPYVGVQNQDGWAMHVNENGVPFLDPSEPAIASDPLALLGGAQGFPLPQDMVRLINAMVVYTNASGGSQQFIPLDLVNERQRNAALPGRNPLAFMAGNRLVPMLPFSGLFPATSTGGNTADRWYNVNGIQISYVGLTKLLSLDDELTLPAVLCGQLIADIAAMLAAQSKEIPADQRAAILAAAQGASGDSGAAALDMLLSPEQEMVVYRG